MQTITTVGVDIAKSVFQVHGVDADGNIVIRRQVKRRYVLAFFQKLPPCLVGIEACASSHYWSRELQALGHTVEILWAVPGIEVVDLQQPAVGLQANNLRVLPQYRCTLQEQKLLAAEAAGVDALVAVYHSDHRELCAHERDWPFRIINFLEVVGASMGLHHDDHFKRLKMLQDADTILADCRDLIAQHRLDVEATRQAIRAMLDEQPVPLRGAT